MIEIGLLVVIIVLLIAILTALKTGFNEVIKGLEAIAVSTDRSR